MKKETCCAYCRMLPPQPPTGESSAGEIELAEQLHIWYLEACQRPESGMDFNPKAQEPYELLPEGSKFLDKYIAEKIKSLLASQRTQVLEELNPDFLAEKIVIEYGNISGRESQNRPYVRRAARKVISDLLTKLSKLT